MSLPALEQLLWRLGNFPEDARRYQAGADAYLADFRLDDRERAEVRNLDVRRLADRGVHTMLLLAAYRSLHGPQSIPQYMQRMNEMSPRTGGEHG